jgi:hypothetical protein
MWSYLVGDEVMLPRNTSPAVRTLEDGTSTTAYEGCYRRNTPVLLLLIVLYV